MLKWSRAWNLSQRKELPPDLAVTCGSPHSPLDSSRSCYQFSCDSQLWVLAVQPLEDPRDQHWLCFCSFFPSLCAPVSSSQSDFSPTGYLPSAFIYNRVKVLQYSQGDRGTKKNIRAQQWVYKFKYSEQIIW